MAATVPKNFKATKEENGYSVLDYKQRSKTMEDMDPVLKQMVDQSVTKKYSNILSKIKKPFLQKDGETKRLEENWIMVIAEDVDLKLLKEAVADAERSFKFSKATTHKHLAISMFRRCQALIERLGVLEEKCQMLLSQCANEKTTLRSYLGKLRAIISPQTAASLDDSARNDRRIEWTITRLCSSLRSISQDLLDSLRELDGIILECGHLLVKVMTLLHMRTHTANYSGTGVAAGAASVVAGVVVGAAGLLAAPVTGGLSVPVFVAGKSLLVSGIATVTPSSIMLQRHSHQLRCLAKLVVRLKARLEIMHQKRDILALATFSTTEAEKNVEHAGHFCNTNSERSSYDASRPFLDAVASNLGLLDLQTNEYLQEPSVFHTCCQEDYENLLQIVSDE